MREFDYTRLDEQLFDREIVSLLSAIHEHKGKQSLYIEASSDVLKKMLEVAKIQSTNASNAIEGIHTSDKRLKDLVEKKTKPRNRNEEEIAGYRQVLELIHDSYEYIYPTPNHILQLHRDLYTYSSAQDGGKFKNVDNIIEEENEDGEKSIRFKPAPAAFTPDMLRQLCDTFSKAIDAKEIDPLLLIAAFIFDFVSIHPFRDGNGRMSRLLTLLFMYRSGYIVGKYISVEMHIERTKENYYESLLLSSKGWHESENDYKPFVKYYLSVILATYKDFSERVELLIDKSISKSERVKRVFDVKLGKFSKSDIHILNPDISPKTIEKALKELVENGYIEKVGQGRSTVYVKKM
ncbi:Fic family protein [Petrocella sp. FN5]|uniref:Fic family protein n=1 Tax=Petrocella sp. FN5 TaxID=3032002 RepID=UPI0023DA6982|nr:Fic family protein [Petrocella sp. FN5]MDF1618630.1 Fic family protein [Petrocella sp. FN5]